MAGDVPGGAAANPGHENRARPSADPAPLALYRKYRPATFAEVKGQEHVTEPLRQALRSGRVHHAYLFSGPRGCGKTSSARILARSLNCEQGPTPDPCGVCASCVALAPSGPGSIDVIEIDAASHGGVDDARDLRERAFYSPVAARYKIYIIDEAHMVTGGGFNALLKLVEEPPPHLKFVFATTEPEKVIPTIRSRTHHYPFRLVPPAILRGLLEEILGAEDVRYEPSLLPLVVRAGAGSVRDSLSVLDQLLAGAGPEGLTYERTVSLLGYTDDGLLDEMVDALESGNGAAVFTTVDKVVEGGHDPRRFAADLLDRLRDLIILAAVPGAGQTGLIEAPADRMERMAAQAERFGQAELTRAAGLLSAGLIQMRGTASPRLLLELTCAQVLLPGAHTDEQALLARLERLERGRGMVSAAGAGGVPERARPSPPASGEEWRHAGDRGGAPVAGGQDRPAPGDGASAAAGDGSRPAPGEGSRPAPGEGSRPAPGEGASGAAGDGGRRPAAGDGARPVGGDEGRRPAAADPARPAVGRAERSHPPGPVAAAPRAAGPVDAHALRERWPDILETVRRERKVSWILLRDAAVASLENGVLTVAFPREGDAKGFVSGHDQVLASALNAMFGLSVQVRAVLGETAAPGAPGGASRQGAGRPPAPAPGPQPAARSASRPTPGSSPTASPAPDPTPHPSTPPAPAPPTPSAQASSPPAPAPAAPTAPATLSARPAPAPPAAGPPPASGEEEWPEDAGEAAGGGLTGMELIKRQLGGQIIQEIEEG